MSNPLLSLVQQAAGDSLPSFLKGSEDQKFGLAANAVRKLDIASLDSKINNRPPLPGTKPIYTKTPSLDNSHDNKGPLLSR